MRKTVLILPNREGMQRVYGMPAVMRLVVMARRLGFDRILLPGNDPCMVAGVSDLTGTDALHPVSNPANVCDAVRKIDFDKDEQVLVMRANHVIDRWSLGRLVEEGLDQEIAVLRNDETISEEAIYLVKSSRLLPLLSSLGTPEGPSVAGGDGPRRVRASAGLPKVLSGEPQSVRDAEAGLSAAAAGFTWHRDSFLSRYVNRPVSQMVSPAIARTRMTANMITLLNTLLGLAGAWMIFRGGYLSQIIGSALFVLCTIVDGVDGEVARLKLLESQSGQILDVTCDNIVHVSIFTAIGFALYYERGNVHFLYLLWTLLFGLGLCALVINRIVAGSGTGPEPTRLEVFLEMLFNNRDFAYVVLGFALFRRLDWFLVASTLGIYVLTGILWVAKIYMRSGRRTVSTEQ